MLSHGRMLQVGWGMLEAQLPQEMSGCVSSSIIWVIWESPKAPQVWELRALRPSAGSQHAWWESSLPLTLGKMK